MLFTQLLLLIITLLACHATDESEYKDVREAKEAAINNKLALQNTVKEESTSNGYKVFTGKIAGKYPITMRIKTDGLLWYGAYYYHSNGKELKLKGHHKNGFIHLIETQDDTQKTGYFEGEITYTDNEAAFVGFWRNARYAPTEELFFSLKIVNTSAYKPKKINDYKLKREKT